MYYDPKKCGRRIKEFTSINTESTIRTIEYQFEYDEQVGTRVKEHISRSCYRGF